MSAAITVDGDGEWVVGGLKDLVILKSAGSEFAGFLTDNYTVLEPTHDRVMATSLVAQWRFAPSAGEWSVDWNDVYTGIRSQLVKQFAGVHSLALQQTLYEMGKAVLEAYPVIAEVRLSAPNKHHFRYDLSRFGLPNNNEVFHADDRPYGLIQATVTRDDAPAAGPAWIASSDGCLELPARKHPELDQLRTSNSDCRRTAVRSRVQNRLSSQPAGNVIDGRAELPPCRRGL